MILNSNAILRVQKAALFAETVATSFSFSQRLIADMHLTNVAVQKTAPDYDPEKVFNKRPSTQQCFFDSVKHCL